MSNTTLYIVVALSLLVIALIAITILMLLRNKKPTKKVQTKSSNSEIKFLMPNFSSIELPSKIEELSFYELRKIVREIQKSFLFFDYKKASLKNLEKKEWHSWQVSMLLMYLGKGGDTIFDNQEEVFHNFLFEKSENSMKSLMFTIIKKYENSVAILDGKDNLCKDYIWTSKEICLIFFFMANYKNYKNH